MHSYKFTKLIKPNKLTLLDDTDSSSEILTACMYTTYRVNGYSMDRMADATPYKNPFCAKCNGHQDPDNPVLF